MLIYCICTQYLVGAPFALITASIRHGMEVISLWHGNTMVIEPAFGTLGSEGRCQVLLENEISISIKLVSRRKHGSALKFPGRWLR